MKIIFLFLLFFSIYSSYSAIDLSKHEIISEINDYFKCEIGIDDETINIDKVDDNEYKITIKSSTVRSYLMSFFVFEKDIQNISEDYIITIDIEFEEFKNKLAKSYNLKVNYMDNETSFFIEDEHNKLWKIFNEDSIRKLPVEQEFDTKILNAVNKAYADLKTCFSKPSQYKLDKITGASFESYSEISCVALNNLYMVRFRIPNVIDGSIKYALDKNFNIVERMLTRKLPEANEFEIFKRK